MDIDGKRGKGRFLRPPIKWPGGKTDELPLILPRLAAARASRLVDPFLGGGAVAWNRPSVMGLVAGDACEALVSIHMGVRDADRGLRAALDSLLAVWESGSPEAASRLADEAVPSLAGGFGVPRQGRAAGEPRGRAFYEWARACLNSGEGAGGPLGAALFWAVRELCYGGLIRFNAGGGFNVPYGGACYDHANLRAKFAAVGCPRAAAALCGADLAARDFADTMALARRGDLVFLDPPYDSPFSAYSGKPFGPSEHGRLAHALDALPEGVSWLAVVGDTPLTARLYAGHPRARRVERREKIYRANIRGRNERRAVHLMVEGV